MYQILYQYIYILLKLIIVFFNWFKFVLICRGISLNIWVHDRCDFVSGVRQTKACATVQVHQFLSHNCKHLLTDQKLIATGRADKLYMSWSEVHSGWLKRINDNEDRWRDYEVFLQYLLVAIAANCEKNSESGKLLVKERDGECHKAFVSDNWQFYYWICITDNEILKAYTVARS